MSNPKIYTLFAGINGAGKSTLYSALGSSGFGERLNSDEIIAEQGKNWRNPGAQIRAGIEVIKKQNEYFLQGVSINRETTLSEGNLISRISDIKKQGYQLHMYYVGLEDLNIAKERIKKRVEMGGHGIDDYTLKIRYLMTQRNIKKIIPYCDLMQLYDNSGDRLQLVGFLDKGEIVKVKDNCKWLDDLIADLNQDKSFN